MIENLCWHRLRMMGARELVRRRMVAGWPKEKCTAPHGLLGVCTKCLEIV
jgi:hypothetical protein